MNKPLISVVMTAFNAEKYIDRAMTSILHQTYSNFEFIIINDGSTDKTADFVRKFQDERIILLDNKQNIGIPAARNVGIKIARGEYIAIMDADDESFPERFKLQVEFMQKHHEVGVLGAARYKIDGANIKLWQPSAKNSTCIYDLLRHPCLSNPTAMIRKTVLTNTKYNEDFAFASDYKLWTDLAMKGVKFANLPTPLLNYYRHKNAVSIDHKNAQDRFADEIRLGYVNYFFGEAVAKKYSKEIKWLADYRLKTKVGLKTLNTLYNAIDKSDEAKKSSINTFFKIAIHNKIYLIHSPQLRSINPFLLVYYLLSKLRTKARIAVNFITSKT